MPAHQNKVVSPDSPKEKPYWDPPYSLGGMYLFVGVLGLSIVLSVGRTIVDAVRGNGFPESFYFISTLMDGYILKAIWQRTSWGFQFALGTSAGLLVSGF